MNYACSPIRMTYYLDDEEDPGIRGLFPISLAGTWGAKYNLSEQSYWSQPVKFKNWTVAHLRKQPFIMAYSTAPSEPDCLASESFRAIQKALDITSAGGGGHYHVPNPWDARVLWWPEDDGIHVRISSTLRLGTLPNTVFVNRTDGDEKDLVRDPNHRPRWSEAMRHFRRGQLAADVVSAFQHMYLAFEVLLEERFREPADREGTKAWIRKGLKKLQYTYSTEAQESLCTDKAIEAFLEDVYEDVRNRIFHAKTYKGAYLPLDTNAAPKVAAALRTLTWHVVELLRASLGWAREERPKMDHELMGTGEFLLDPPSVTVLSNKSDESNTRNGIKFPTHLHEDFGTVAEPIFTQTIPLEPHVRDRQKNIAQVDIQFPQGPRGGIELGIVFGMDDVVALTVDVAPEYGLSQLVRTHYPERSGW